MKTLPSILMLTLAGSLAATSLAQNASAPSPVIAPGAKLEKLAGDFKFTEGPTC